MDVGRVLENDRTVAIVHYRLQTDDLLYHGGMAPQNPAVLLQITLLQDKLSPSKKLIRLGDTRGDEITGWTKLDALEVVEILGRLSDDNSTVIPIEPEVPSALVASAE